MDIRDIFENKIKIESKVMSIESLFNNQHRVDNTDFKPSYQRNYVWNDEKATYFIESILLGTEIPPLVFFRNVDKIEVIDGRQRYQTILRFKNNEFRLRKNGLHKLGNIGISNTFFRDLDIDLKDSFWDTKLRLIEFSFPSYDGITSEIEEFVKREIFKRYNSGITPLKPTEIDSAIYLDNDLNAYLKDKLNSDEILFGEISDVFHFEKKGVEVILKKVRQLLVQHEIPIKYYSVKKQSVISKFYDSLFDQIDESEIQEIYSGFIYKLNLLKKIKSKFKTHSNDYNRLISESLYWAFSVIENEGVELQILNNEDEIASIVDYLINNIDDFGLQRSSFAKELNQRYLTVALFFEKRFNLSLSLYLENNPEFKERNSLIANDQEGRISFEELRLNKPEPSSIAITDISRAMERQRFLIRPPYQRREVINKKKSSLIIESILLGIKIPPFFVLKREDGVREVLDGQQRLLSLLGFIGAPYLNEKGEKSYSAKNGYSLYLKNSILTNLHGIDYQNLSSEYKERILNFDLWLIEIDSKYNKKFEPIDLFVRLNDKPYPIKEDTFEMWNSYISRDIVDAIKSAHSNQQNWFYLRKNNSRMEDENIYTALAFLQYSLNENVTSSVQSEQIDIYKVGNKINFRLKSKNEITKTIESSEKKNKFLNAINDFEFDFLRKIKLLLSDDDGKVQTINRNLDELFLVGRGRRTQQSFYALWHFLFDISIEKILTFKNDIRREVQNLFILMTDVEEKLIFEDAVLNFKEKYNKSTYPSTKIAQLKEIAVIQNGYDSRTISPITDSLISFNCVEQDHFSNFRINNDNFSKLKISKNSELIDLFESDSLILISSKVGVKNRFNLALHETENIGFKNDIIGIMVNRPSVSVKYVLALLSSRYYFFKYFTSKRKGQTLHKALTAGDFGLIEMPIINTSDQLEFSKLIDYIRYSKGNDKVSIFFERIIDALVYESVFTQEFKEKDIHIKIHLQNLPILDETNRQNSIELVNELYRELSSSNHGIGKELLSLMNLNSISEIESHY